MEKRVKLLEKALVNSIIENAELKEKLTEKIDGEKLWYRLRNEEVKKSEALGTENKNLTALVTELKTEIELIRGAEVKEMCEIKEQKYSIETE